VRLSASSASTGSSGGSASALSSITSAATPPWSDQQDRSEHRILGRAQDQLDRMRPLDHRLHHEAVDVRAGRHVADFHGHGAHGVGNRLLRAEVELDAAHVGLCG